MPLSAERGIFIVLLFLYVIFSVMLSCVIDTLIYLKHITNIS